MKMSHGQSLFLKTAAAALGLAATSVVSLGTVATNPCGYIKRSELYWLGYEQLPQSRVHYHLAQRNGAEVGCTGRCGSAWGTGPGGGDGGKGGGKGMAMDYFLGAIYPKFGPDLYFKDAGFEWFAGVSYNGCQEDRPNHFDSNGTQGYNWMQDGHPEIQVDTRFRDIVGISLDANKRGMFAIKSYDPQTETVIYVGVNGTYGAVKKYTHDNGTPTDNSDDMELYEYQDRSGKIYTYFGDNYPYANSAVSEHSDYQLWKVDEYYNATIGIGIQTSYVGHPTSPYAAAREVSAENPGGGFEYYTPGSGLLKSITKYSPNYKYIYTYSGNRRLIKVEAFTKDAGSGWENPSNVTIAGQVDYTYYDGIDVNELANGLAGDLRTITTTTYLSDSNETLVQTRYIRYYVGDYNAATNPGAKHMIKLILDPEGVRRYSADHPSTSYAVADDNDLKNYSSVFVEYALFDYTDGTGDCEYSPGSTCYGYPDYRATQDLMVSKVFMNGECGCPGGSNGSYTYNYESNNSYAWGDGGVNGAWPWGNIGNDFDWTFQQWYSRTTIGRPDGSYQILYFDIWGQQMGSVIADGSPTIGDTHFWPTKIIRNADGNIASICSTESITSYDHSTGQMDVSPSAGLVQHFVYSSDVLLKGSVTKTAHSQGLSSTGPRYLDTVTEYLVSGGKLTIDEVDTLQKALPTVVRRYHQQAVLGQPSEIDSSNYDETTYAYTFYDNGQLPTPQATWLVKSVTTTLPTVATTQNGSNTTDTMVTYLRRDGTTAFTKSIDGIYNYTQLDGYDRPVKSIRDIDQTTTIEDAADATSNWGFTLPSSGGLNVKTEMAYDAQGRVEKTTLPNGRVTQTHWTKLNDGRLVTISVPKVETTGTPPSEVTTYYGPASISVSNLAGRGEISATMALDTTTTHIKDWINTGDDDIITAQSNGLGLTNPFWRVGVQVYDNTSVKVTESRSYFDLTGVTSFTGSSGIGSATANYDKTVYTYDDMGRAFQVMDPTGTISITSYDKIGRAVSSWIGTNAYLAEFNDPTGDVPGISGGNNMVKVSSREYDGGNTGNHKVTSSTQHVDSNSANDRTTSYLFDYRNRPVVTLPPLAPYSVVKYDNLGRTTAAASYSTNVLGLGTDPTSTTAGSASSGGYDNRLSLAENYYDSRGRVYRSANRQINQSTGVTVGEDDIISESWYSPAGDVIQTRGSDILKFRYDRLHRRTNSYTIDVADRTYADILSGGDINLTGDKVAQETQTVYEDTTGKVLFTVQIERHHNDTTSTGALDTNADGNRKVLTRSDLNGRPQITAMWYDVLDRPTVSAEYGTYGMTATGGTAAFDYASLSAPVPSASDPNVLVTKREYDSAGFAYKVTDPRTKYSLTTYDRAGRTIRTVANAVGVPGNDTAQTYYKFSAGRQIEMWVDMDLNGTFGGSDQKTTYDFATTKGTSPGESVIASNRLLSTTTYPDSASSTDKVFTAYNAQGQPIWSKDQAGNVTEFVYDKLGRETLRRFTTVASGFDGWVKSVGTTYTVRGQVEKRTQYDDDLGTAGHEVNELMYVYDDPGNLWKIHQDNDSAVNLAGGGNHYTTSLTYDPLFYETDTGTHRSSWALTFLTYPDGTQVGYNYSASTLGQNLKRVARVHLTPIDTGITELMVEYSGYNGVSSLIQTGQPNIGHSLDDGLWGGTARTYSQLDRYNRITRSRWGRPGGGNVYNVALTYDNNSNILTMTDARFDYSKQFDRQYNYDGMNRLTSAYLTTIPAEIFTMDRVGNFTNIKFNQNFDSDFTDAKEYNDTRTHNRANEIMTRDTNSSSPSEFGPQYDAVGNMTSDTSIGDPNGLGYRYTYDVLGRLTKVETNPASPGTPVTIALFQYDANNQRVRWRYPTANGGGSSLESQWHDAVYDHRWRQIEVRRDESVAGRSAQARYERYYYHNAGLAGSGNASYIDHVIARDRNAVIAPSGPDPLEERTYYVQNWRGDVVALMNFDGSYGGGAWLTTERVRYSAYGRPFCVPSADYSGPNAIDVDGVVDSLDATSTHPGSFYYEYNREVGQGGSDKKADFNHDGVVNTSDQGFFSYAYNRQRLIATASSPAGQDVISKLLGNRKGYAGYEHEPWATGNPTPQPTIRGADALGGANMMLARNRFYRADLGTWMRRDPIGYVDGADLYGYVMNQPVARTDYLGFFSQNTNFRCGKSVSLSNIPTDLEPASCPSGWIYVPERNLCMWIGTPSVPGCPLTAPGPGIGDGWCRDTVGGGHCGLTCYRSYGSGTRSGQQCCYDQSGNLDTRPDCMGTVDLYGCANGENAAGNCTFDVLGCGRHRLIDVRPWKSCKRLYNELHCCMRQHGIPSGTPSFPNVLPTDAEIDRILKLCRAKVYEQRKIFCQPPSTAPCKEPDSPWKPIPPGDLSF